MDYLLKNVEMDEDDPISEAIRDRRSGRFHPPEPDFTMPRADPVPGAAIVAEHLPALCGGFWEAAMPHAGDAAIDTLASLLSVPKTDKSTVLTNARAYDQACRAAEAAAGIDVDVLDCSDLSSVIVSLCSSGAEDDIRDEVARWMLPHLPEDEIGPLLDSITTLTDEARGSAYHGHASGYEMGTDEIVDAVEMAHTMASDMIWRDLCCARHPECETSDDAVFADEVSGC